MVMADRTCKKCGHLFRDPSKLRRHLANKKPCDPIIDAAHDDVGCQCKYCGRRYSSKQSMYRHIRENCKIANSEDGMQKLVEHTLQKKVADQGAQIAKLTELVEKLTTNALAPTVQVNNDVVVNDVVVNNIQQNIIALLPWDAEKKISISVEQIAAAFAENSRLKEYSQLGDHKLTDPEIAPPYVTELFMDLVKRGHTDPASRNVYLNPRRSDQVLVHMKSGKWEVLLLEDATRQLFDGVASTIHRVTLSYEERKQLPIEAQNALSMAGMMYDDEPDEFAKRAKTPMSAHLTNLQPLAIL